MGIKSYIKDGKKFFEVTVKKRDSSGNQIRRMKRGIPSERKATEIEYQLKQELDIASNQKPIVGWRSWLSCCVEQMRMELRASTVLEYEGTLSKWVTPIWSDRDIRDIKKNDIHEMIYENLDPELSPHTKKKILKMIRRVFQMAYEEGIIDRNPSTGFSFKVPEAEQKVLNPTEVSILLNEARITCHRFYPVWVVALMTGMRSGELYALQHSDIDYEGRLISVSKQWTNKNGFTHTKTRRSRMVPISDSLLVFLKKLKIEADPSSPFVLPRLREWENGDQALVLREFCTAIGITPVKFHDLRATFITNMLSAGVSLARVMAIVGHSQLKTTNGYLRKAGVEIKGATEQLHYRVPEDTGGQVLNFTQFQEVL